MSEKPANDAENTPKPLFPEIREVDNFAALTWLRKGWADFRACPTASLFYGLCFVIGGYLMIFSLRDAPEYIAAVITGFVILGPFLALGLYELSARRERGEPCDLRPSLSACQKNVGNMGVFALLLLVVYLVWARASVVVFAVFYSGAIPSMGDFLTHVVLTDQIDFLLAYFAVGAIFALIIFAISLISIPLIKDQQMDAITAALSSVRALFMNPGPMIIWAGTIAVLAMLGMVTFLLGTLIIGPLLGHATWHAYRDLTGTTSADTVKVDRKSH